MKINENRLAFFTALCFFLSALEFAFPKPLPFFRIGFANIPIMISFCVMTKKESAFLILLKVLVQSIIGGTLFSYVFIFSLAGTLASGFSMMLFFCILKKHHFISWVGLSLLGSLFNNLAQIFVSYFFIFGDATKFFAPIMLSISFCTSIALGIFTEVFVKKSAWFCKIDSMNFCVDENFLAQEKNPLYKKIISVCSIFIFAAMFFIKNVWAVFFLFVFYAILNLIFKNKVNFISSILMIFFITLFSIFEPQGKILFEFKNLKITQGSLILGLLKSFKLCLSIYISKIIFLCHINFKGKPGIFISKIFYFMNALKFKKIKTIQDIDSALMNLS